MLANWRTSDRQDKCDDAETESDNVGDEISEQRENACEDNRQGRVSEDACYLQVRTGSLEDLTL